MSLNTIMKRSHAAIGRRMRSVRQSLGMTQAELAEAAGIDPSFYGQIERGTNVPSLKTFLSVAAALGVDPADLLPRKAARGDRLYEKAIERLVRNLGAKQKKLVLGMVSDMVGRLKR